MLQLTEFEARNLVDKYVQIEYRDPTTTENPRGGSGFVISVEIINNNWVVNFDYGYSFEILPETQIMVRVKKAIWEHE